MSLDLIKTASQIDNMAVNLKAHQNDRDQRIENAIINIRDFSLEGYKTKRDLIGNEYPYPLPIIIDPPISNYSASHLPNDYCLVAVDGSHIDTDRHLPTRCFLINTGTAIFTYGSNSQADLINKPKLYVQDKELVIKDPLTYREQAIEGAILGAKRAVEEAVELTEAIASTQSNIPTLGLLDGSLLMLGITSHHYQDFVSRNLIEDGFVKELSQMKEMSKNRSLMIASYISFPRSADMVNALRLMVCPYKNYDVYNHCSQAGSTKENCDQCVGGLLDRDLYSKLLGPGQRSGLFSVSSTTVDKYYGDNEINFFYLNTGNEIGRVEIPSWIASDVKKLNLTHTLILDQCNRGRGYPIGLMEAHEQAVINGSDRRHFVELVENALYDNGLPSFTSEKALSKRLKWL